MTYENMHTFRVVIVDDSSEKYFAMYRCNLAQLDVFCRELRDSLRERNSNATVIATCDGAYVGCWN